MPRIFTLQFKDIEIPVSLQSFSRDTLYGKSSIERRGEANEIYSNALLPRDGAHILPYRAIGANYTDPEGNFLAETLLIDSDGKAIPVARSMFKEPVKLTRTISLKDFYAYNVDRTYVLKSENIDALDRFYLACRKLLEQDRLYRFTYAYYDSTNPQDAILVPKDDNIFIVFGEYAELIMLKPSEILFSDIEEEELEEEIAFEVW